MADFRKWLFAFAVVALLLGMGNSAYAQLGTTPAFTCVANAGVPPIVRAEGITELVGDLVLNCTGGAPTPAGAAIPLSNIQIFLNTNVTSRTYAGGLSEGIITIDDPYPSAAELPNPGAPQTQPNPQAATNQLGCQATNSTNCAITGTGGGFGGQATSPYNGSAGRYNVFQGAQNGANQLVWLGVPIDAPGTTFTRIIRITNVRANACQLGVSSTLIPTQIVMFIAVNGSQQVTINNPQQTVAYIQPGLVVSGTAVNFVQCVNINGNLLVSGAAAGQTGAITVNAIEGFASSFKVRNYAQLVNPATLASLATNGAPPSNLAFQNVLGFPYNTESGFVSSTPGIAPNGTVGGAIGLADQGTQIQFAVNNIGAGVTLIAPNSVALVQNGTAIVTGLAVLVGSGGGGGASTLAVVGNAAVATYEIWYSNANVIERLAVPFTVAAISNTGSNLPGLGTSTVTVNFAPQSTVNTTSTTAPIPRFCSVGVARNLFTINPCTCNLLFPFVTNQAGFNTGIALANTSVDPFGTTPQSGPVTINYYGNTVGGGAAPPAFKTQTVPAGAELIFTLMDGGNFGVPATPGFQGYIITVAQFQFCHAFAFISDIGAQKVAEGYVAIQLDVPVLNRTGVAGENEGH